MTPPSNQVFRIRRTEAQQCDGNILSLSSEDGYSSFPTFIVTPCFLDQLLSLGHPFVLLQNVL